ncbi:ABC transporter permease subunit [Virgibacillus dakarensis]|uniref:Peptide ABC transporter substrate-binding protein n=1 Tax=Lentibacillus populi TaxID=1827502 RepID=A0A9W5TZR9_9BACI|nr:MULTISPECIES: nickel transporter permease [Bacillaceae]MBT2216148.1 ABC transporter permease [Virgibacillus dakarensis]MTW86336.1 ABC transporter permease subunit [Virgibacillus dakarensis]GGB54027.1 peptide ABC transporter substrate-binding protein [Lentibacillus populi]
MSLQPNPIPDPDATRVDESIQPKSSRLWVDSLIRIIKSKTSFIGLCIILILILTAIFAPMIATHNPIEQNIIDRYQAPSSDHLLGTDELGRDIFSRIVHGSRISIQIGVIAVGIALIVGVLLGGIAGYFGRWVDQIIMRIIDIMMAFPSILLAIALVAVLGPSLRNAMIAVGIVGVPQFARIVRSAVLSVKETEYVEAARAIGAKHGRVLMQHVLPNCLAPIIVQTTLSIGTAILDAAGLSFLGLGAQPPTPEWGAMLSDGRAALQNAPWVVAFPGIAIFFVVLGFNLFGDGLRDALDPRLKQ